VSRGGTGGGVVSFWIINLGVELDEARRRGEEVARGALFEVVLVDFATVLYAPKNAAIWAL
jgi:hypothetical protein